MTPILDALANKTVLGALPQFRDLRTWGSWVVFLKSVYGDPLTATELVIFQKHTGRAAPLKGGYPEAVLIVGRQSGKSQIAGAVAAIEATRPRPRGSHVLLIAQDSRAAQRALFTYVREVLALPAFTGIIERETADTLELANGTSLSVYPCRPSAVRGVRSPLVVVDELAFFLSTEGNATDTEMLRAVRPTLATTGGRLIVLSSPYSQHGALWDLHRQHYGAASEVLIWKASAPEMNPKLPANYLARMERDDPEAFRSEVMGEFRAGLSSLFDPESLDRVTGETPAMPVGARLAAHYDASGGRSDAAALAVGWRERSGLVVVSGVTRWPAPHDPGKVIAEAAEILKLLGIRQVQHDRFSGEFCPAAFRANGIHPVLCESTTSDNHLGLAVMVNAQVVRLPADAILQRELRGLERRAGTSGGKDRADHRGGAHDDVAASVSGLCAILSKGRIGGDLGITFPPEHEMDEDLKEPEPGTYWTNSWGQRIPFAPTVDNPQANANAEEEKP